MAFHYYHATALRPLRNTLFQLLKSARRELLPQTPQTIIVSNLDTEHYLRDYLLDQDGVVMGIEFPFLEGALENFSARAVHRQVPLANQNWFSDIQANTGITKAGMLELELAILAAAKDSRNGSLFQALGYTIGELNELQLLALSHKLALRFREYLLHSAVSLMQNPALPVAKLWALVKKSLSEKNCTSMLTHPELFYATCRDFSPPQNQPPPRLYLFGLPIISAAHVSALGALAGVADVHLLSVDFSVSGQVHPVVKERYAVYAKILAASATHFHSSEIAYNPPGSPHMEIWALPGTWRAAEILGDYWHDQLTGDADLRQDHNQAALTELADDFAAFENALASRDLTATSRTRLYERAQPLCELIILICDAQQTLDRNLILAYWHNSAVTHAFGLDAEKISLFRRALENAQGFRNDYPGCQEMFNLDEAINRLARGPLVPVHGSAVPATPLREFENPEMFSEFLQVLDPLLSGPGRLSSKKGPDLIAALEDFLHTHHFGTASEIRQLSELLGKISGFALAGLTLGQLAKLIARFLPPLNLKQSTGREGILFSALSATPFTAANIVLFDLGENLDAVPENDPWLAEYDNAPTRLTRNESVMIALETARLSGAHHIILGYSNIDPVTGAEKYPSQALGDFQAHLASLGMEYTQRTDFAATVLDPRNAPNPPLSSQADARTVALVRNHGEGLQLSKFLLPPRRSPAEQRAITISELEKMLLHPTRFLLGTALPANPELAEFSRTEPRLAAGKGARLQFASDYFKAVIRDTSDGGIPMPSDFIALRRRMGIAPPDGFDETSALLRCNENENNLRSSVAEERDSTRLVEIILSPTVERPFSVADAPRLERRYFPSRTIDGVEISGTISGLLDRKGELIFPLSGYQGDRTLSLARVYLWTCLLDNAAITLGTYETPESKAKRDLIDMEFFSDISLPALPKDGAKAYVEELLSLAYQDFLFWFDLALIAPNKLGSYHDAGESDICELLLGEPRGADAAEAAYLRRFFDLQPDAASYAFFRKHIVPVAAADVAKKVKRK